MGAEETLGKPVQTIIDGSGPTYHRTYGVDLTCSMTDAMEVMRKMQADPGAFSPKILARFEKTEGPDRKMQVGDAYHIHISGPWDGPVRVSDVKPESFTFVTLKGHMEAGRITFRITQRDGKPRFEIESVARSKNSVVDFIYDKVPLARLAQTFMWKEFCKSFVKEAIGTRAGEVDVRTEKKENR